MSQSTISRLLMVAGLIPFLFGTIAVVIDLEGWGPIDSLPLALALYALAIASFMCGIHWGIAQTRSDQSKLLVHSNVMVVLLWVLLIVFGDSTLFYAVLVLVFLKQYLVDRQLVAEGVLNEKYLSDRLVVTCCVCILMSIVAVHKLI